MRTSILALALGLLGPGLLGFGVSPARAAADYLLEIEGIPGEVASAPHQDWIAVRSFQSGVTNPPGSPRPGSTGFVLTKQIDKATPLLMLACAQGQRLDRARLEVVRQGTNQPLKFFVIEMEDVLITSFGQTAREDANDRTEEVMLDAGRFTMTYFRFDLDDQPVEDLSVYWDFIRNEGGIISNFKVVVARENNQLRLTWPAQAGRTYHVHGSTSVDGTFGVDQTITATETGPLSTTMPFTSPNRFFYVEEVQ
jgi:type VI secretion system secreted protein Hcp